MAEANITDRGTSQCQRALLLAKQPGARRTQRMLFDLLNSGTPSNSQFCQVVAEHGVAHAHGPLGMTNHLYISDQGGSRMLHSLRGRAPGSRVSRHCPTKSLRSPDPKAPGSSSSLLRSCRRTGSQGALRVWAPWASPGARSRVSSQRATAAACLGREPGNPEAQTRRGADTPWPLCLVQLRAESSSPAKLQGFASKASCVIMTTEILRARLGSGTHRCKFD